MVHRLCGFAIATLLCLVGVTLADVTPASPFTDHMVLQSGSAAPVWGEFVPAKARIDGETVVVSSTGVAAPTAVRYAWESYPEGCNLYNRAGLPAAPFKTDKSD